MSSSISFKKALSVGLGKEGGLFCVTAHYNMMTRCQGPPSLLKTPRSYSAKETTVLAGMLQVKTPDSTLIENHRDGSHSFLQPNPVIFAAIIFNFFYLPVEPVYKAAMNFNVMENMKPLYLHSNTCHVEGIKQSNIPGPFL